MKKFTLSFLWMLAIPSAAMAVDVLVLSSGRQDIDTAVVQTLEAGGHSVTLGVDYHLVTDQINLNGIDVVYLQINANYNQGDMPASGQQTLLDFVDAGGGLVTCEWTNWMYGAQGYLKVLGPALPTVYKAFTHNGTETFQRAVNDPILSDGVDTSFNIPVLDDFGGTETKVLAKCGATEYYSMDLGPGVVGWNYGIGRVLTFATINGVKDVSDENLGRLLSNGMEWASLAGGPPPPPDYADCDQSGLLDLFDFLCFNNAFNSQQDYADCDGDGSLSLFDFLCFVNSFNGGC